MSTKSNLKGSGAAYLAVGIAFLAIGASGQMHFVVLGLAFIAIAQSIAQSKRSASA